MRFSFMKFLAAGLASVMPVVSFALSFSESADFPGSVYIDISRAQFIGALDPGLNVVQGALDGQCLIDDCNALASRQSTNNDTQDSFTFEVPEGFRVDAITVSTSESYGPTAFRPAVETKPATAPFGDFRYYIPLNGGTGNILSQPLAPGVHHFSVWGSTSEAAGLYQVNYAINFSLSAVPELSTLYQFAIGGALMLIFRRSSRA